MAIHIHSPFIAIENGPFIVDLPRKNGDLAHSYVNVYQAGYMAVSMFPCWYPNNWMVFAENPSING